MKLKLTNVVVERRDFNNAFAITVVFNELAAPECARAWTVIEKHMTPKDMAGKFRELADQLALIGTLAA